MAVGKFWEETARGLAGRWLSLAGPAVVFWTATVVVWFLARGQDLTEVAVWLSGAGQASQGREVSQAAVVVLALVVVTASALVVSRLTPPVLRLLEGYWPAVFDRLARVLVGRVLEADRKDQDRVQELMATHQAEGALGAAQARKLAAVLERMRHRPPGGQVLPTRVGNILRAGERRPGSKYGLDAVTVWPRLWLVMPASSREELAAARGMLDAAVAAVIWGVLFAVVGLALPWSWWTAVTLAAGLTVAFAAVRWWVPWRAVVFADLVDAAFDVHRKLLYDATGYSMAVRPDREVEEGQWLTRTWHGNHPPREHEPDEPTRADTIDVNTNHVQPPPEQ